MKGLVCALLICSICSAGAPAKAMDGGGIMPVLVGVGIFEVVSLVYTIGNLTYAVKGKRPGTGWTINGVRMSWSW